jgi:hypothetical protein
MFSTHYRFRNFSLFGSCGRMAEALFAIELLVVRIDLLDRGQLTFTINSGTGFVEAVMARLSEATPVVLGFTTEIIPIAQKLGLPVGSYTLDFLIASDSTVDRCSITITIRNQLLEHGAGLQRYLHVQMA